MTSGLFLLTWCESGTMSKKKNNATTSSRITLNAAFVAMIAFCVVIAGFYTLTLMDDNNTLKSQLAQVVTDEETSTNGLSGEGFGDPTPSPATKSSLSNEDATRIYQKVAALTQLPQGTPQFATVNDVSKLQGQDFFAKAANGDVLLIYSETGQAILYRESSNEIISVGTVASNQTATTAAP